MSSVEKKIAQDEVDRAVSLPDDEPHTFVGRLDRDCERCGKPDRNPIHISRPSNDQPNR